MGLLTMIGIGCGIGFTGLIIGLFLSFSGKKIKLVRRANNANQAIKNKEIEAIRELIVILCERNGLSNTEQYIILKTINDVDDKTKAIINKIQHAELSKKGNVSEKAEAKTEKFK